MSEQRVTRSEKKVGRPARNDATGVGDGGIEAFRDRGGAGPEVVNIRCSLVG